jgi:hypothetical protein
MIGWETLKNALAKLARYLFIQICDNQYYFRLPYGNLRFLQLFFIFYKLFKRPVIGFFRFFGKTARRQFFVF